ncbi:MAG: hypothetical protein ACRDHP_20245 [Ktedonobacterales bacterium]
MSKPITIALSDEAYAALERAGAAAHQTPEEVATNILDERFGGVRVATPEELAARDRFIAEMRARGVFTDPKSIPPYPGTEDLPPYGTLEWQKLWDETTDELGEAFARSGLSVLDLIERR